ncbi:MAG: hypothetical protein JWN01_1097 [Patescibacteria group bacterium]|nr:hypothetical protein [Patescibacteria group bacterium]
MLLEHFTNGTGRTTTGAQIGCEIETDFVDATSGEPITQAVSRAILASSNNRPLGCEVTLELGRQKIELAIRPCRSFDGLLGAAHEALNWLYGVAARYNARPVFAPEILWADSLLDVSSDPRDQVWVQLDGQTALEELCRCSSVQFTVDVNPWEAIGVVNALWIAEIQRLDYMANHRRWQAYIAASNASYRPDRYAGPQGFDSLADYANQLARHDVVMHQGQPVRLNPLAVSNLDIDLFLRSIWWHYRLRRYGDVLTVEIRPLGRRGDGCLEAYWQSIAPIVGC